MTIQTLNPAQRTIRTVKPMPLARNRFERMAWIFMRFSGLILVFLSLSHFWLQHLIVGTHQLQFGQTVARWGAAGAPVTIENVFWRLYYVAIIALAMLHGLNGFRQVAYDYLNNRGVYRGVMIAATGVIAVVSLMGLVALLGGATIVK